jgi:hypothetical protein
MAVAKRRRVMSIELGDKKVKKLVAGKNILSRAYLSVSEGEKAYFRSTEICLERSRLR